LLASTTSWLSRFIPHNTRRVVAPPGRLRDSGPGEIVLVASLMRSGTHVLIDCILNNFARYRRRPLYIDLDQFVGQGLDWRQIADHAGPYLVKTHFPQVQRVGLEEAVTQLLRAAKVLIPRRSAAEVLRSSEAFDTGLSREELPRSLAVFDQFWSRVPHLSVEYAQLIDREHAPAQIERLAGFLGEPPRVPPLLPPDAAQRLRIYTAKLATRLLGDQAPVINTTIRFSGARRRKRTDPKVA
jgi:hypothetical protein